jgi:hypothetical protein
MLQHTTERAYLLERARCAIVLVAAVVMSLFRVRSARWVRHDRIRPVVKPRVPLLIPPVSDQLGIGSARVDVEGGDVDAEH